MLLLAAPRYRIFAAADAGAAAPIDMDADACANTLSPLLPL
jgi:hypothetical protein